MAKSYDETSLDQDLVVEPERKAELKIAIEMLARETGERADEIWDHFGLRVKSITIDMLKRDIKVEMGL